MKLVKLITLTFFAIVIVGCSTTTEPEVTESSDTPKINVYREKPIADRESTIWGAAISTPIS